MRGLRRAPARDAPGRAGARAGPRRASAWPRYLPRQGIEVEARAGHGAVARGRLHRPHPRRARPGRAHGGDAMNRRLALLLARRSWLALPPAGARQPTSRAARQRRRPPLAGRGGRARPRALGPPGASSRALETAADAGAARRAGRPAARSSTLSAGLHAQLERARADARPARDAAHATIFPNIPDNYRTRAGLGACRSTPAAASSGGIEAAAQHGRAAAGARRRGRRQRPGARDQHGLLVAGHRARERARARRGAASPTRRT